MTRHDDLAEYFKQKGVRTTANRILVLRALMAATQPMSLNELETTLYPMDKSSISRVLTLFLAHDIVHAFEDGRGVCNYELCASDGVCLGEDEHIHFYCERCQHSYCMETLEVPPLRLPKGYSAHAISIVKKGICPHCQNKRS